ncbi:MAG: hypothetical protein HUU21_21205 [Polyangiaceae bacterium]|nr:hypothetical protein [Polyangiaceae bacterium]
MGEHMKSHGLSFWVGTSFAAVVAFVAGCPVQEADEYPDGTPRPFSELPPVHQGGAGGAGGAGGMGGKGPICGDLDIHMGETCDDGNQSDGDGCSAICQEEECWDCVPGMCQPLAFNTPCNNGTQVCDGKGACGDCVPTDVVCNDCKSCAGSPCSKDGDCASMACVTGVCRSANGSTCVDSVECASNYCKSGTCAYCTNDMECSSDYCYQSKGQCLGAVGEPCSVSIPCGPDLDCTSINICKGGIGSTCMADHECATNRCLGDKCASCMINGDCASGVCQMGTCAGNSLPNDAYCVNDSDCASNKCTGFPRKCAP